LQPVDDDILQSYVLIFNVAAEKFAIVMNSLKNILPVFTNAYKPKQLVTHDIATHKQAQMKHIGNRNRSVV